jgi:release factor glutamine methyltransferase
VNEHVLIPRPETELLVELALKHLPKEQNCKVADLGTGSGAIALSLSNERPNWHITATDMSMEALNLAQENAKAQQLSNIDFQQGPWCEALREKNYDAIISNPPYLAENDVHLIEGDLRFEPQSALVAGATGLETYEIIISQAKDYLKPLGLLILEHGFDQRAALIKLLQTHHYQNIETFNDYQNLPRAITAKKPS